MKNKSCNQQAPQVLLKTAKKKFQKTQLRLKEFQDNYLDIYLFSPMAFLILSPNGIIVNCNLVGANLLNLDRLKVKGKNFELFVEDNYKNLWRQHLLKRFDHASSDFPKFELGLICSDGVKIPTECMYQTRHCRNASTLIYLTITDIRQRQFIETDLRLAASAFESQEGIMIFDAKKQILKANQTFTRITGYRTEDAYGKTFQQIILGDQSTTLNRVIWDSVERTGIWLGQVWLQYKNGEIHPHWLSLSITQSDNYETTAKFIAKIINIASPNPIVEQFEHQAFHDPLTNLPNRLLLKERLRQALMATNRSKRHGAIMFIDLDNFKRFNDTFGHYAGDQLLLQVAQRLRHCLRKGDTAARLGGDEFVVMLNGLSERVEEAVTQAEIAGQKILVALNKPYDLVDCEYCCTPSIGVSLFGHSECIVNEDDLLKCADIAMYHAKSEGRNRLRFFDQNMQALLTTHTEMERDLRYALTKNQFKLYYQIQRDLDGKITGVEALLRWQHPKKGLIAAEEFMSVAENTGIILLINQWLLKIAVLQLKVWEANPAAQHLQLAINICARQFHQNDFVRQVKCLLDDISIIPQLLTLEISQGVASDHSSNSIEKINALNELGVSTCLDGFGIGDIQLSTLIHLPFHQLKVDQSLITSINATSSNVVMMQAIIELGNRLGMTMIAKGIETKEQMKLLANYGCSRFQGYLFGNLIAQEDFENLLPDLDKPDLKLSCSPGGGGDF